MEAEKPCFGPGQDAKLFTTDDKLIQFGVKGQNVRLFDVFFIGPLMLYGGIKLTKENPILGPILSILGITTVYYNGKNYLKVKDSKMFHEFEPSLYERRSVAFENPRFPFKKTKAKLNLVVPKYKYLENIGLSNRGCLSSQLGYLFGPEPFKFRDGKRLGNCPRPELRRPFTMRNTLIPLDIAFLNKCGQVISIRRLPAPGSKALVTPPKGSVYAIEANAGWFEINKVRVGDVAIGTGISYCEGDMFNFERGTCG